MAIPSHHFDVIKRPLVTEKSMGQMVDSVYVFEVETSANKVQIRDAVEAIWNVKVAKVRSVNTKGQFRRNKFGKFRSTGFRKAYVKLKEGYAIELV